MRVVVRMGVSLRFFPAFGACRSACALAALGVLLLGLAAALGLSWAESAHADSAPVVYNYVILVDTSGSMSGNGPGNPQNIFPRVQSSVGRFIGSLDVGNSVVYIYPFSSGLGKPRVFRLNGSSDKAAAQRYVNDLVANGATTMIYDSLGKTIREMRRERRAHPGRTHVQTILLFTDGNDTSHRTSLREIVTQFKLARGENPFLFLKYVTLGTEADPRLSKVPGIDVVDNPPGSLPDVQSVRVTPAVLDFGSIVATGSSQREVEIVFDAGIEGAAISFKPKCPSAAAAGGLVEIRPATVTLKGTLDPSGAQVMRQTLTLTVGNLESLDRDGVFTGRIDLATSGSQLVVLSPPLLQFRFTLAAEPQVVIGGAQGAFDGDLGSLDPYDNAVSSADSTRVIRAEFNDEAEAGGASVTARVVKISGPDGVPVSLSTSGGAAGTEVKLTPENPECTLSVPVEKGAPQGGFEYSVTLDATGASLTGVPVDSATDLGALPVSFSIPAAPPPLWETLLKWLVLALVVLAVLAAIVFVTLCVITGTGLMTLAAIVLRRLRPTFSDARIKVTQPFNSQTQLELTGKKLFEMGADTSGLEKLPFALRFAPRVSILAATDTAVVAVSPEGAGEFTLLQAATGVLTTAAESALAADDRLRITAADGSEYEFVFDSFTYVAD